MVHADDVGIWRETNNEKKNAETSLAAIHVAGTELTQNTNIISVRHQNEW